MGAITDRGCSRCGNVRPKCLPGKKKESEGEGKREEQGCRQEDTEYSLSSPALYCHSLPSLSLSASTPPHPRMACRSGSIRRTSLGGFTAHRRPPLAEPRGPPSNVVLMLMLLSAADFCVAAIVGRRVGAHRVLCLSYPRVTGSEGGKPGTPPLHCFCSGQH